MQFSPIRTAIIVIVAVLGILLTIPSFLPKDVLDSLPLPFKQTVVLGLDLQGGSHLLLQVNRESIITERIKSLRRDVRSKLANENGIGNLITTGAQSITVELTDPTQKAAATTAVQTLQNNVSSTFGVGGVPELAFSETPDGKIVVSLTPDGITERMASLIAQSMEVIRNRVDEVGTTEPRRYGVDRQHSNGLPDCNIHHIQYWG